MTKFSIGFGNTPRYGGWPPKTKERNPEEEEALGRYARAIDAIKAYADENGLELVVVDGNDKSEYMCMKQIGNFSHGFEETIHLRPKKKKGKKRRNIAKDGSSVPGEVDDSDVIEICADMEAC
ncbi:hypothetical protein KY330_04555, partial [Candidatus Woesearchaeota archaeon]|nr:hypothetical protein [Candidatus Woesearchaeota archaeon]